MEAYSKDTYFMNILKQVETETRILQSKEHIQHGTTTVYEHCVQVHMKVTFLQKNISFR